jgi:hypothetical protein
MCYENLEPGHDLSQGDRAIVLPFLNGGGIVDEDDEVFVFAFEKDFGLSGVATGHDCKFKSPGFGLGFIW